VRAQTLDRLLSGVGEVALASRQLRAASADGGAADPARFATGLDRMDSVLGDLERRALELRTAPLLRITEKLPRLARELGIAHGKRVSLELEGVALELDRSILDRLADTLLHLVRNAVAHGIETPAERRRLGKPEVGSLRVEARRERDGVEIAVVDDGAGIDIEAVRRRAVAAGIVPSDLAEDLPPDEIARLVFHPGLSTAAGVTPLAGRGVGLDAVRAAVEALGGQVDLLSEPGRGTTALLRVPLSAAVQRVILIGVGDQRVGIPIGRVERIDEIETAAIERAGREAFVPIDGLPLPLLDLATLLAVAPGPEGPHTLVLLAEIHGQRTALRFDRLLGQEEVFVKPVPPLLAGLRALCGLTLGADGRPVFLVEPDRLL
jgi:two-component system chemotaxis sensor kinase CheA